MLYLFAGGMGSFGLGYRFLLLFELRAVTLIDEMLFCRALMIIGERVWMYGIDLYWMVSESVGVGWDEGGGGC